MRIADYVAEIQTSILLNTSALHYCYTTLFSVRGLIQVSHGGKHIKL